MSNAKNITLADVLSFIPAGQQRAQLARLGLVKQGVSPDAPEAYVGHLADLRGPKWPSRLLRTHVVVDVVEVWPERFGGRRWRVTGYSLRDGTRCEVMWDPTWLPRRCV